jgi:hypothetical protein
MSDYSTIATDHLLTTHYSLPTTHSLWQTELSHGTVLRSLVSWLLEACGSCRELNKIKAVAKRKR